MRRIQGEKRKVNTRKNRKNERWNKNRKKKKYEGIVKWEEKQIARREDTKGAAKQTAIKKQQQIIKQTWRSRETHMGRVRYAGRYRGKQTY